MQAANEVIIERIATQTHLVKACLPLLRLTYAFNFKYPFKLSKIFEVTTLKNKLLASTGAY